MISVILKTSIVAVIATALAGCEMGPFPNYPASNGMHYGPPHHHMHYGPPRRHYHYGFYPSVHVYDRHNAQSNSMHYGNP